MNCKDMTKEELDKLLIRYVSEELSESEAQDAELHIFDCDDCSKQVLAISKVLRISKENFVYEDLCEAYDNKDWQDVIRLGDEMEDFGYDEEVYPIKGKVAEAKANLSSNKFSITVNGETDDIEWENEEIVYPIPKSGKLTIEYDDKLLLDAVIGKDQLSQISIDQHVGFHHHDNRELIFPGDQFDIEIIPGIEYKLVIKPKKNKSNENK